MPFQAGHTRFILSKMGNNELYSTFKIKESLTTAFVRVRANQTRNGTAANQVKMKLNGSGSCIQRSMNKFEVIRA